MSSMVEHRRRELLGGPGACPPWEILTSQVSEMAFPRFETTLKHSKYIIIKRDILYFTHGKHNLIAAFIFCHNHFFFATPKGGG